jgi:thioredoxin-related protein
MIWFTDSKRSPLCKTLSNELLGKSDFGDWANQNVIRFRVDQSALASTDVKMDAEVAAASHVLAMKSKYKVKGSPTILLLSPRGNQIARYRGYKPGTSATLWGQLKYSVGIGNKEYQDWLKSLQKQGYRIWRDQNNRQILAKLVKYNQGELSLIEPDGGQLQTKEKSLSAEDRAWIAAEKKKRGIE